MYKQEQGQGLVWFIIILGLLVLACLIAAYVAAHGVAVLNGLEGIGA